MNIMLNQKKILFMLCITTITTTSLSLQVDLKKLSYLPTEAPSNADLIKIREGLFSNDRAIEAFVASQKNKELGSLVTIITTEKKGQRLGVCFKYAVQKVFKCTEKEMNLLSIVHDNFCHTKVNILSYFKQTNYPIPNALVVYLNDKNYVKHFGIVRHSGRVESKIGSATHIVAHPLWLIPNIYGHKALFFTPEQEFQGEKGKISFLKTLHNKIVNIPELIQSASLHQRAFFESCGNKPITIDCGNQNTYPHNNLYTKTYNLLKRTGVKIDEKDPMTENKTALMLAAQRGDLDIVKLLITHKAQLDLYDNNGNTALMLAAKNNHCNVIKLLLVHGADPRIKNNENQTAAELSPVIFLCQTISNTKLLE